VIGDLAVHAGAGGQPGAGTPHSRVPVASGDAVRWFLLTAEEFGATEALRIGLVQEVVPAGQQLDRAVAIVCAVAA